MVLAVAGCSLNTTGVGSDRQPELAHSGVGTGATSGLDEPDSTSGAADDPSESGPSAGTGSPVPVLVISDDEIFEFGGQDIGTTAEHTFVITNEGSRVAMDLAVGGLGKPFTVHSSDCESVLAPEDTCRVVVHFAPELFGGYEGQLEVAFEGAGGADSVVRPFTGRGVGTTGNLLRNGGGEQGSLDEHPPLGWESLAGASWASTAELSYMGDYSIFAGLAAGSDEFILFQSIDAAGLTNWGDAEGVRFYYRAYHRGWDLNNDLTQVSVRFSDAQEQELEQHPTGIYSSNTWMESTGDHEAPPRTHDVQMFLECHYVSGYECGGYFDEVELWAEWSG